MSIYRPTCPTAQPAPRCTECPTKELGDIRGFALVEDSVTFADITSQAEWETYINASTAYVFPFSRGGLEIAEEMEPGFGDIIENLQGYEFVATLTEPNYLDNCDFWNEAKRNKKYRLVYRTETQVHETDNIVTIIPKALIEADNKKKAIHWLVIIKFSQEDIPCPNDQPTSIFNECLALN
jgi:hypothetical protein